MCNDFRIAYRLNILIILISLLYCTTSFSHEIRPAFLRITQINQGDYGVSFKIPKVQNRYPDLVPTISGQQFDFIEESILPDALIKFYSLKSSHPLGGETVSIVNLEKTLIDVMVQFEFLDGTSYTLILQPDRPSAIVPSEWSLSQILRTYFILGVEHIILGYDHLFFVLGLLLIIPKMKVLITTITSFTVAHSITLIMASLDLLHLPSQPVEAVIALSIVLLALEAINFQKGKPSWTLTYPWAVAFLFGLIHGLGFAGALAEIGLPQKSIFHALLIFNLGVEAGQLLFILFIISMYFVLNRFGPKLIYRIEKTVPYLIGSVGCYWMIERITGF